jgi:TRAP-type C4-dicarboxylate transport system permease small subunit
MALREKILTLNTLISYPIRVGKWVAAVALAMMVIVMTANSVGRYVFSYPLKGAEEIVELMMIFIVFLFLAQASTQGSDVAVTFLVTKFSLRVRRVLRSIFYFFSAGIVGLIAWRGFLGGMEMWRHGEETGVLEIVIFPFFWVLAFGTAVLSLKLLLDLISLLSDVTER